MSNAMKQDFKLPGILLIINVAVVFVDSTPGGLLGLETVANFEPSCISINCLTSACSSLNNTCSVIRFQIKTFPDSVEIIYLQRKKTCMKTFILEFEHT